MISANLAQNRLRLIHDVNLYMGLYGMGGTKGVLSGEVYLLEFNVSLSQ